MNEIHFCPRYGGHVCLGYQYDHNNTIVYFDGYKGTDCYLKLELADGVYTNIPIPDLQFIVTNTYTKDVCTYRAQIMQKVDCEFIANSPVFTMFLKPSIPEGPECEEVIPPNFQTAYDRMVEVTKQIEDAYDNGEFDGSFGVRITDLGDKGYAADKTFEQIEKAHAEGRFCVVYFHGFEIFLNDVSDGNAEFVHNLVVDGIVNTLKFVINDKNEITRFDSAVVLEELHIGEAFDVPPDGLKENIDPSKQTVFNIPDVLQETGTSEEDVISQKKTSEMFEAVDTALTDKASNSELAKVLEKVNAKPGERIKDGGELFNGATEASGVYSHAEGNSTNASGESSHAEGFRTTASEAYSHAEGYRTTASGSDSHAEGCGTVASGSDSHAEGFYTTASANVSHAEGSSTKASGVYSHAEGFRTTASANDSHAEGNLTNASANDSHAEGNSTNASGAYSHAEGFGTTASAAGSHAEGSSTKASGESSHAEGEGTIASGTNSHVEGKYNIADDKEAYAHILGNGTDLKSSNAHTVRWNGKAWYADDVLIGGKNDSDPKAISLKKVNEALTAGAHNWFDIWSFEVVEASKSVNHVFTDTPCKKVRVIINSLAAEKDTNYANMKFGSADVGWNHIASFYLPVALPTMKAAITIVTAEIEKINNENWVMVECSYMPSTAKTSDVQRPSDAKSVKFGFPAYDTYNANIGDLFTYFEQGTYGSFAPGTKFLIQGYK